MTKKVDLSERAFQVDLKKARSGKLTSAQLHDLIDKWGERGGVFYGFVFNK